LRGKRGALTPRLPRTKNTPLFETIFSTGPFWDDAGCPDPSFYGFVARISGDGPGASRSCASVKPASVNQPRISSKENLEVLREKRGRHWRWPLFGGFEEIA
jgi:hypothetical protein